MRKLISIDIKADFGMLKNPDTNEPVYLTFNMLHKPALLGIFGAIIGLKGFQKKGELPEYYDKLKNLKIGIQPLNHENGNYSKTIIKYNNTTGFASEEKGGNLIIDEQTLIAPAFRCYVLLNLDNENQKKLYNNLKDNKAEYLPYLGKNEFSVWWENFNNYDFGEFSAEGIFKISSIFIKEESLKKGIKKIYFTPKMNFQSQNKFFSYFENLPVSYHKKLFQYEYKNFTFTNWDLKNDFKLPENYPLIKLSTNEIIQVF
jgi:CRISPR-associated protein Cas5h